MCQLLGIRPGQHCSIVLPYTTVGAAYHIITPPRGGFPSSIARQPRGCQYRTMLSWESSRRDVLNADRLWHRHCSNCCGDFEHGNSGPGVASVICTVVYGGGAVYNESMSCVPPNNAHSGGGLQRSGQRRASVPINLRPFTTLQHTLHTTDRYIYEYR